MFLYMDSFGKKQFCNLKGGVNIIDFFEYLECLTKSGSKQANRAPPIRKARVVIGMLCDC